MRSPGSYRAMTLWLFAIFLYFFPLFAQSYSGGDTSYYVDWERYKFEVLSTLPLSPQTSFNERYYFRSKVKEHVLREVSTGIEGLYIDNTHRISDLLDQNSLFRREYPLFLESVDVIRLIFRNNVVEASTSLPLRGESGLLRRIPIPWQTMHYSSLDQPEYVGEGYLEKRATYEYKGSLVPIKYTGLVIDARGMGLNEALLPRIFSEDGRLVYGPEYIIEKIGVERGIVGYASDMDQYEVKNRGGESPFFTVALSTKGYFSTDLVISNEDAARALEHPESIENLLKCRVIILTDSGKKNVGIEKKS